MTIRRLFVVTACLVGTALPAASSSGAPCITPLTERCEVWSAIHDGPAGRGDIAETMAVSPDGTRVFVGGAHTVSSELGTIADSDFVVLAYSAATGQKLWTGTYGGPGNADGARDDYGLEMAISADGSKVFLTGSSQGQGTSGDYDFATAAFDAATGQRLWASRFDGGNGEWDQAEAITTGTTVDADGIARETVYITGWASRGWLRPAVTIAYDVATGEERWQVVHEELAEPRAVSFTSYERPDGSVGGRVHTTGSGLATAALDAETGEPLWRTGPELIEDGAFAWSGVASPDGSRVYATGARFHLDLNAGASTIDTMTIAFDAETGDIVWSKRYIDPDGDTRPERMTVSPTADRVFVTGGAPGAMPLRSAAFTVAYDAATGTMLWERKFGGVADEGTTGWSVAASPDGRTVYTAAYYPFTVIAYDAATGGRSWVARYTPPNTFDGAYALAPSPDGRRLFAAGGSAPATAILLGGDMLTVAFDV